jgi:hypothetical protein
MITSPRLSRSLPILLLLLLWWTPSPAVAAPPAAPPAVGDVGTLTAVEVERLATVEPFEVVLEPIQANETAYHLASACRDLAREIGKIPKPTASSDTALMTWRAEVISGEPALLSAAIQALRAADTDAARAMAPNVATMLAIVAHDIDELCRRISSGSSTDEDIRFLRVLHGERARTLLRYQQLLTRAVKLVHVADLVAALMGVPAPNIADPVELFLDALAADAPGKPQALPSPVTLGAAAMATFEGLAEFLIDRAKQETLDYIRDTLVDRICSAEPGVFLPKTCALMSELHSSMALSAIGKMLHASVLDDLERMPDRLLVLAWMRSPEVAPPATVVRLAAPMLADARLRKNPLEYAASIHSMLETDCEKQARAGGGLGDQRCAETLAYLRVASALLRAASVTAEAGDNHRELPFLVLGVAFELERLLAEAPRSVRERIASRWSVAGLEWTGNGSPRVTSEAVTSLSGLISESIALAIELEHVIGELGKTSQLTGQSIATPETILAAARSTMSGMTELAGLAVELGGDDSLQRSFANASKLVALAATVRSDDPGRAVLAMFEIVAKLTELHDIEVGDTLDPVFTELGKYLPLFVEIANAKSSADVKATLEAAFPAGGYRLKYRQPAVSLNGFVGIYGGGTYLFGERPQLTGEAAMFAPIGVQITRPVKRARKASHLGLMLAVVDLGAITTSKFFATEVAQPPTDAMGNPVDGTVTTVEQPARFNVAGLLSPGAYFTVGLAESPFSFGIGASVNPFVLQQVDRSYAAGTVTSHSHSYLTALRFGAFFAVDITMLAFGR